MALPQEQPVNQAPEQAQAPQEQAGQFENMPTPELVSGIHDGMLQLLQNVDQSQQASPQQKQAIAGAIQAYRSAIATLGGEQGPQQEAGGNTTLEQGATAETIPV